MPNTMSSAPESKPTERNPTPAAPTTAAGLLAALAPQHALSPSAAAAIIHAYASHKLQRRRPLSAQQLTNKLNVLEPRTSPAHKAAFAAVRRELSLPAYTPVSAARRPQMVSPEAEVAFVSYVGGAVERREARGEWVEIPYDSSDEEEEK